MPAPHNPFKAALKAGDPQMGCWLGLADPYVAEISAGAGFDWLLIDAEHAPNDLRSIIAQLQVIAGFGSHAVIRPTVGETWMIKQLLDAGAQTLLVPMVESAEQARELVKAVTYPPHGIRGVGSALARASNFSAIPDYLKTAREEICLLVQVENRKGMEALDEILQIEGIDGVFIGPSDLAADMGHIGNAAAPEVEAAVLDGMRKIVAAGKAGGILTLSPKMQRECLDIGATFVATDIDVTLFASAIRDSAKAALSLLPDQSAHGTAETSNASRYLQQLCKHWSHKAAVEFDPNAGTIRFDGGNQVQMSATATQLAVTATTGPRGDLERWKGVVSRHLERFAFREEFSLVWQD
ncbi:aldolase/citrate lyase family protein [Flavimaricola marinus]|uniref:Hydroxypyruvate/pyruvate aldolase n=1 Tax=Flavimaricola marinus TaxID=1819565 RepID=A0A238LI28_9RHOB|nr:aldolase/citrate lyase family protein [Flavimaricola marinus]SMY09339.1 4-hydroxy-2-oxo-heptane-1,7-dioate aldolase [Flavimaricola marinus]